MKMNKKILIITAKGSLAALVAVLLYNTKLTYEFKKKEPFYKQKKCLKTNPETIWEYHWGYNEYSGRWHYHYGPNIKKKCVESVIDTIEIN
jgi:hypothetical protein